MVFLGTLNSELTICKFDKAGNLIGNQAGCYNLDPIFDWIKRCIYSIFLVFMIAFLPLFLQGLFGIRSLRVLFLTNNLQNWLNVGQPELLSD